MRSAGEESCDIRDRCVRFGERLSYCDPQIPASAGVRPCVCFSVSRVEFSGRLLLVVLGSLWNWRMAGLRSLCLRVVGMVLPSADQAGVGWSSASFEDTVLGVVGRVWTVFVARASGGSISFEVFVSQAFGRL